MKYIFKIFLSVLFLIQIKSETIAQVAPPYPQADPAVITISKQGPSDPAPTGSNIVGSDFLKFRVANNSADIPANGKIPAGSVFYTVQFNPYYTYSSLVPTTEFAVTFYSGAPDYVVQLTNLIDINPGDVLDFYLVVNGLQPTTNPGGEIVTLNVDRTLPISCGNTSTANDNVSKSFSVVSAIVTPVRIIDLRATLNGNTVDLKWITVDELNTKSFTIERSIDGQNFSSIGSKDAAGNTVGSKDYFSTDQNLQLTALSGIIYYRIKVTDIDGKFYYSRIVSVKYGGNSVIEVWPNPFKNFLNVQIRSTTNSEITIYIYNAAGAVVLQQKNGVTAGVNALAISIPEGLARGHYYIEIKAGAKRLVSSKLIKE